MKKLLIMAAVIGLSASAAAESEMTHKAEFRLRSAITESANLQSDKTENATKHRFKLSSEYKANDKLSAQLTLVHNAGWGQTAVFGDATSDRSSVNPNNGTNDKLTESSALIVNEAYATWMVNDQFTFKVGRGSFEAGDGTSTAVNDFQDVMTAFDGIAGIYELDFARIVGYYTKFADLQGGTVNPSPIFDPEANTVGISADFKFLPEVFEYFNVGVNRVRRDPYTVLIGEFNLAPHPTPATPIFLDRNRETYIKYNFSTKATFAEMFNIRASYSAYNGEQEKAASGAINGAAVDGDIKGQMLDVEAGIHLEDAMNFKFSIGYHQDSGDSDATDQDNDHYNFYYYDVHKYGGLMDVVKWGNLTYFSAKTSFEPIENFEVGLEYHMFTATEKEGYTDIPSLKSATAVASGINSSLNILATSPILSGGGATPGAINTTDDDIGSEIDIYARHRYDSGLTLEARYGLFMAGDRLKKAQNLTNDVEDIQTFFVQGTFEF